RTNAPAAKRSIAPQVSARRQSTTTMIGALRYLLMGIIASSLVACGQSDPQVRQVTIMVQEVIPQRLSLASDVVELPYATVVILECGADLGCEEAVEFEEIGSSGAAVRMTGLRCDSDTDMSDCELIFTPGSPKVTVWMRDGDYALLARAFAEPGGVFTEYCTVGGGPIE